MTLLHDWLLRFEEVWYAGLCSWVGWTAWRLHRRTRRVRKHLSNTEGDAVRITSVTPVLDTTTKLPYAYQIHYEAEGDINPGKSSYAAQGSIPCTALDELDAYVKGKRMLEIAFGNG